LLQGLSHHSILRFLAASEDHEPPYMVTELVGPTLKKYIKERGTLPVIQALEITTQLSGAVCYLFEKGIVHRDVKPGNILLSKDKFPKLIDFSVALDTNDPPENTYDIRGTLAYLHPDAVRNINMLLHNDHWGLGIMLCEMIKGRHPFPALTDLRAFLTDKPLQYDEKHPLWEESN